MRRPATRTLLLLLMVAGSHGAGESIASDQDEAQGDRPASSGGLGIAKGTEIFFESTMEALGRMTKGHKLVGAILSELPLDTKGPFIANCLSKLSKAKELGQPLQTVIDAQKIIENLQAGGQYRPKARGVLAGTKDEIQAMAEQLEAVHADKGWKSLLRPQAIGPEDVDAAASLTSPLRQSVADLLAAWKRREALQERYKDSVRIVSAYRGVDEDRGRALATSGDEPIYPAGTIRSAGRRAALDERHRLSVQEVAGGGRR